MKNKIFLLLFNYILIILINPILTEIISVTLRVNRTERNTKVIGKDYIPKAIYINGINSSFGLDGKIYLEKEGIYNVTLEWDNKKKSYDKLFSDLNSLLEIDLSNFDTSEVTSMKSMFSNCKHLDYINFKNIDTSSVVNMASMFENCFSLRSVDLSNFNTSKVSDMNKMFKCCYTITFLNLSNFYTSQLSKINEMFSNCYNLRKLIISNFNTDKLTSMNSLFYNCYSLSSLNISYFNTENVKTMKEMFKNCISLYSLDLSNIVTSSVTDMSDMFSGCESLYSLDLSNFVTSKVIYMNSMFNKCFSLRYLNISNFNISNVESIDSMFKDCRRLLSLDLSSFIFTKQNLNYFFYGCNYLRSIKFSNNNKVSKNIAYMFYECSSLKSLNLSSFDFSLVEEMEFSFYDCHSLTSLDLSKTKTLSVKHIQSMFEKCKALEYLNLTNFKTSTITNISYLFRRCETLKYLDLSGFNTSNVNDMSYLFSECHELRSINLSSFDTSLVTDMNSMFFNCNNLVSLNLSNFNTSLVTSMEYMFYGCNKLESLNLSNFDTSLVTSMEYMFNFCTNLKSLKLTNFNTSLVTSMEYMFSSCYSLELLDISNFNTSSVINMENMFSYSSDLTSLDLSSFNTSKVLWASYMFSFCSNLKYINFYNFEGKAITLNYIFTGISESLIVCTKSLNEKLMFQLSSDQCLISNCSINLPYEELKLVKDKRICLDYCFSDQIYKYEFKNYCYDKCPQGTHPILYNKTNYCEYYEYECVEEYPFLITEDNSCSEECNCRDFFDDICKVNNNNIKSQSLLISNIIKGIEDGLIDELLLEIIEEENDTIKIENNILYQITSSFNQNNKSYENISSINMTECENYLREKYDILENETLIIFKTEKYLDEILIPIIEFEVFNPKTKEKLNLNYCKNLSINYIIYIPVFINESNLYKHEQNSSYYNDICYTYTTENGTDITLYDRQKEFNDKNLSLCPLNCAYNGYDQINKKSICLCEFQERILFSDINYEQLVHNFSIIERKTNFDILKCYKLLFLEKGLIKNAGNYIILLIIILYIISGIYFYLKGYDIICNQINDILNSNFLDNYITNKNYAIKKNDFKEKIFENFPTIKKSNIHNKKNNSSKESIDSKLDSDFMFSRNKNNKYQLFKKENIKKIGYVDYEINTVQYNEALKNDQRTYLMYYLSVIKKKHLLISAFIPNKDYNAYVIKICLPFFSLALCLSINALFFNDTTIHIIYIDKGSYNFKYFLPKVIYSLLLSSIIIAIIKRLSLTQQNILEIKNEKNKYKLKGKVLIVLKRIIIKFVCFFVLSIFFLILFWYYLSCFCAVYKNTQKILIKSALISYFISLIYPFIFWIIPGIFRIPALKGAGECFYKISQIIQVI